MSRRTLVVGVDRRARDRGRLVAHRQVAVAPRGWTAAGVSRSRRYAAAADARKITATLYFVSEDGMSLVGVQREVPFGETVLEQARQIVTTQLAVAPAAARLGHPARARRCGRST